jgi:DNA-binding response OmpR family regulator
MKKILIIDDDPAIQEAFRLIFNKDAFTVTLYTDGSPLLEDHFNTPDIIILDKQLRGVDGIDLCKILKSRASTKDVPVIIISASPSIERMARLAGADEVLEKPFSVKTLRDAVLRHLKK